MFNRLAGSDKEIDAAELQDILTICLKHGKYNNQIIFMIIILQISLTVCLISLFVVS